MWQLFASCFVRHGFEPIRVTKIVLHHSSDSCTVHVHVCMKVFHVSPKREFAHFCLALFNKKYFMYNLFYILKTKLIRAFMNGNKIKVWHLVFTPRLMTDRCCAWSGGNKDLTFSKDCAWQNVIPLLINAWDVLIGPNEMWSHGDALKYKAGFKNRMSN